MSDITIIVPCYNHGRFLREAIDSIHGQTQPVAGTVVVDDGSDDPETLQALTEIAELEEVTVISQENQGPAAARNRAMQEVRTPFVASLDADDRLLPEFVEKLLPLIHQNPAVGIVYGEARSFGDGAGVGSPKPYQFPDVLLNPSIYATAIFRTEDWKSVGGFREEMREGWEDFDFWISIIEKGREVIYVEDPVFEYRRHQSSRDTDFSASQEKLLNAFESIYRNHPSIYSENIRLFFEAHLERLQWRDRFGGRVASELRFERDGQQHTLAARMEEKAGGTFVARFDWEESTPIPQSFRFDPFTGPGEFRLVGVKWLDGSRNVLWEADSASCPVVGQSFSKCLDDSNDSWPTRFFLGRDPQVIFECREPLSTPANAVLEIEFHARTGSAVLTEWLDHLDAVEKEFNASAEALRGARLELSHVKAELEKEMAKRRAVQQSRSYRIGRWLGRRFGRQS